jgi:uncharacterized protein (DUF983 family)
VQYPFFHEDTFTWIRGIKKIDYKYDDAFVEKALIAVYGFLIVTSYIIFLACSRDPWWLPFALLLPYTFAIYLAVKIYHRYIGK